MGACAAREREEASETNLGAKDVLDGKESVVEKHRREFERMKRAYERTEDLKELFKFIIGQHDVDGDGLMDKDELYDALQHMMTEEQKKKNPWTRERNHEAFEMMDTDQDRSINQTEFVVYYREYFKPEETLEEFTDMMKALESKKEAILKEMQQKQATRDRRASKLTAVFSAWDMNQSGSLDREEIALIGWVMHDGKWTDRQTNALMKRCDLNGDGEVACDEFLDFYKGTLYDQAGQMDEAQFERGLSMFRKVSEMASKAERTQETLDQEREEDQAAEAAVKRAEAKLSAAESEDDKASAALELEVAQERLEKEKAETAAAFKQDEMADKAEAAIAAAAQRLSALEEAMKAGDKEKITEMKAEAEKAHLPMQAMAAGAALEGLN